MAIVVKDRVKVTTTTTGTGTITLGSAETGFQSFSVIGDGNQTYYTITSGLSDYEVGIGTYNHSASTLTRGTILESSNAGAAITLAGTSTVFTTYPAERATFSDQGLSKTFTADGVIAAGKPTILTSAGKAQQFTLTGNSVTQGLGTDVQPNGSDYLNYSSIVKVSDTQFVAYFTDSGNSNRPTAIVGTIGANKTITYGSKQTITNDTNVSKSEVVWDSNASKLHFYNYVSTDSYLYGATSNVNLATNTISGIGTWGVVMSNQIYDMRGMYDPDNNQVVLTANRTGDQLEIMSMSASTSPPTISFDTTVSSYTHGGGERAIGYDTNVDVFVTTGNDEDKFVAFTNSGSAFTASSVQDLGLGYQDYMDFSFDPDANKFVYNYYPSGSTPQKVVDITVDSSRNLTVGTPIDLGTADGTGSATSSYDPIAKKHIIFVGDGASIANYYPVTMDSSGTITVGSATTFANTNYSVQRIVSTPCFTAMDENPIVIFYGDNNTSQGESAVFTFEQTPVSNLDNNYLGVASTTASDTEEVKINLPEGSINNSQSGLTVGDDYFCNTSGEIKKFISSSTSGAITEVYSAETALNDPSEKVTVVSDGDNTFLMVYQGTSLYTTIQAGTMSGTTMTWGTAQVFESTDTSGWSAWWDSYRSCFVVVARGTASNSHIRGKTITVSGQAITIVDSSDTTVFSGSYDQSSMVGGYDSTAQVGFVVNTTGNSPTKTSVIVVSADSSKNISWGSEVTSNDRIYYPSQFVHDSSGNGNVSVIGATYNSSTTVEVNSTQAYVITISGTTPTIKTPVVLNASAYRHGYSVYDASANKTICIYDDATKVYYNVCSMSSGTLTAGTHTEIATGSISGDTQEYAYCGCYDPFTQQIGIVYGDSSNYYYLRSGKVSGTSITWSSAQAVDPSTVNKHINLVNANSTDSNVLVLYWVNFDSAFNTWTMGSAGTTTYVQTDAQYIGEAISTTALKLKETPTDIIFGKASNTIAKGNPVIVEADGDFAKVTSTGGNVAEITAVAFTDTNEAGYGNTQSATSDGKGIIAVAYKNTSNYPTVTLGSMATDGTITWGSDRVLMSQSIDSENLAVAYAPNYNSDAGGFYMSTYRASNTRQVNWSITYSGTTSTYAGDAAILSLSSTHNGFNSSTFDTTNNKAHVLMLKPYSAMYTISNTSGTTISVSALNYVISGSASSNIQFGNVSYDNTNNTGVIVFRDEGNSDYPTAIAYTISGDTFTFGSKTVIESSACYYIDVQADTGTNKTVVAWGTATSGATIKYVTLDYSGTTITVNTVTSISSYTNHTMNQNNSFLTYSSVSEQFYLAFNRSDLNYILLEGAVNSSDNKLIDWTEKVNRGDTNHNNAFTTYSGKNNLMMLGSYHSNELWSSSYGGAYSNLVSNLTTENFIGLADNASSANGTSKVRINGVDANNSGFTAGQLYYVKNDATFSETAESGKVVEAGKAISATKLLVKG